MVKKSKVNEEDLMEEEMEEDSKQPSPKLYTVDDLKKYYKGELERIEQEELQVQAGKEFPEIKKSLQEVLTNNLDLEKRVAEIQKYLKEIHPIIVEMKEFMSKKK